MADKYLHVSSLTNIFISYEVPLPESGPVHSCGPSKIVRSREPKSAAAGVIRDHRRRRGAILPSILKNDRTPLPLQVVERKPNIL